MVMHVTFKAGEQQAYEAARYFREAVEPVVALLIEGFGRTDQRLVGEHGAALVLRTWSAAPLAEEEWHDLIEQLLELREDLLHLHEINARPDALAPIAANWLSEHLHGRDLYVELAVDEALPNDNENPPILSLGMLRGRAVLLSSDTALFIWLQQDLFGLTVAGQGSYLLEIGGERLRRKAS